MCGELCIRRQDREQDRLWMSRLNITYIRSGFEYLVPINIRRLLGYRAWQQLNLLFGLRQGQASKGKCRVSDPGDYEKRSDASIYVAGSVRACLFLPDCWIRKQGMELISRGNRGHA